jgi:hypothetical protein
MEFLIMILVVYGMSAIVTISKIFEPVRDLAEKHSPDFWSYLASCMQCFPFWAGILVSFLTGAPLEIAVAQFPGWLNAFFTYLLAGSLFSGTTLFLHTVFIRIQGERWVKKQEKETARKIGKGIIKAA